MARKAPRRYNWVEVLDGSCSSIVLPPRACQVIDEIPSLAFGAPVDLDCSNGVLDTSPAPPARIVLMGTNTGQLASPAAQQAYELDDVTVARVAGYMLFTPYFVQSEGMLTFLNGQNAALAPYLRALITANQGYMMRFGLIKDKNQWDQTNEQWSAPSRDPYNTQEWTDGRFRKMWTHEVPYGRYSGSYADSLNVGSALGVCSNVEGSGGGGGASVNSLVDGTGNINTSIDDIDISTTCEVVSLGENAQTRAGVMTHPIPSFRLNLNMNLRTRLRESESLSIWYNWGSLIIPQSNCIGLIGLLEPEAKVMGVGFMVRAHVKALVET